MVWGNGRLSDLIFENHPFFIEKWPIFDQFLPEVIQIVFIMTFEWSKWVVKPVKLKKSFRLEFFSSWTVKLLFDIFRRLSYSFLSDLKSNLGVHWVYLFHETNMNSISASRFYNEFTVCFSNSLWILFFANHYVFTISFANSLDVSRIFYESTICFVLSLARYPYSTSLMMGSSRRLRENRVLTIDRPVGHSLHNFYCRSHKLFQ